MHTPLLPSRAGVEFMPQYDENYFSHTLLIGDVSEN
jgi:hypothetical protein